MAGPPHVFEVKGRLTLEGVQRVKSELRSINQELERLAKSPGAKGGAGRPPRENIQAEARRYDADVLRLQREGMRKEATELRQAVNEWRRLQTQIYGKGLFPTGAERSREARQTLRAEPARRTQEAPTREQRRRESEAEKARIRREVRAAEYGVPVGQNRVEQDEEIRRAKRTARVLSDNQFDRLIASNQLGLLDAILDSRRIQESINIEKSRVEAAVRREYLLTQSAVSELASNRVASRRVEGRVAQRISGSPEDLQTLGVAAARSSGLRSRVSGIEARQVYFSDKELDVRADTYRAQQQVRDSVKQRARAEETARAEVDKEQRQFALLGKGSERRVAQAQEKAARALETQFRDRARQRAKDEAGVSKEVAGLEKQRDAAFMRQYTADKKADAAREKVLRQEVNQALAGYEAAVKQETRERAQSARSAARFRQVEQRRASEMALPATRYQQVQQWINRRTTKEDRPAASFPTFGQAAGSAALTTSRFALSGALLYGGVQTIREMVQSAGELETAFNQIEEQFRALGKGGDLEDFKQAIVDISRDTGQATTDVAKVAFQLAGAFGQEPGGTQFAIEQTTSAIKIARVTGLDLNEVIDSLTAASKSFGVSIERVGDEALFVQEHFGVLARESIKVFGDLGVAAAQSGLDIHELGGILGGLQQIAGRSGATLGEQLGRILPELQGSASAILTAYQQIPKLQGERLGAISEAFSRGDYGQVLIEIIKDFKELDSVQQAQLISQVGSRREAATLTGVLKQYEVVLKAIEDRQGALGKLNDYFEKSLETLSSRLARARQEFSALGRALFEAGLGDFLKNVATAGGVVLRVLTTLATVMRDLNKATGGMVSTLAQLYLGLKALQVLRAGGILWRGSAAGQAFAQAGVGLGPRAVVGQVRQGLGGGLATATTASQFTQQQLAIQQGASRAGFLSRLGTAGAVGTAGGPMGVAAALGTAIIAEAGLSARTEAEKRAKQFEEELNNVTQSELLKIVQQRGDFLSRLRDLPLVENIAGGTKGTAAREVLVRRQLANLQPTLKAAREAGAFESPNVDAAVKDAIAQAEEGSGEAIDSLLRIIGAARSNPKIAEAITRNLRRYADIAAQAGVKERVINGDLLRSVEEARSEYEAGFISVGEYIRILDSNLRDLTTQLPSLGPEEAEGVRQQIAQLQKTRQRLPSELAKYRADYQLALSEISGESPEQKVGILTRLLQNPEYTDPTLRRQTAKELADAFKAVRDSQVENADTAAEAVRLTTEGLQLPPEASAALLEQAVSSFDIEFTDFLRDFAGSGEGASQMLREASERAVRESITVSEAVTRMLQEDAQRLAEEIARLDAQRGRKRFGWGGGYTNISDFFNSRRRDTAQSELDKINNYLVDVPETTAQTPGNIGSSEEEQKAARQTELETTRARIGVRRAQQAGNIRNREAYEVERERLDVEEAEVVRQWAEANGNELERIQADTALEEARRSQLEGAQNRALETQRARIELTRTRAEGNPLAEAQAGIDLAQLAIENATSEKEELNAIAQLLEAQRGVIDAQVQEADAYASIDKALAEAAGDTVRGAELELEGIRRHLQAARERGNWLAAKDLEAQQIAAEANVVASRYQKGVSDVEFYHQMEQVSTQQAIGMLEALRQIPGLNEEQLRELQLRIKRLRDELGQDLQFGIPQEINLPTLYEVRRLNQSQGGYQASRMGGVGYQDNRHINVEMNVNSDTDYIAAFNQMNELVSASPNRYGTQGSLYTGA